MLWNPIHRKPLKNRPEERVRLRIIEFLLFAGWSKHRISTEEAIGKLTDTEMRTDIICYSQQFKPRILIECKAEYVPISRETAEQAARYNQNVEAPYMLLTNGIADIWYEISDRRVQKLGKRPEPIDGNLERPVYQFKDWLRRGFAGSQASPPLRKWFSSLLPELWHSQPPSRIRFLTFKQELTDLDLNHYYIIQQFGEQTRLALSTLTTPYGGSRLVAIFNEDNQNKGVLEVNLDQLYEEKAKNSIMYFAGGVENLDAADFIDFSNTADGKLLAEQIHAVFLNYDI